MKYIFTAISIIIITTLTFQSCNDDVEIEKPQTEMDADIILAAPKADSEFYKGDTLKVKGSIKADVATHGYEINIVRKRDELIVDSKYEHIHKKEITLQFEWINSISVEEEMYVEIIAHLGHNNHEQKYYKRPFKSLGKK
jgi:hypothetical protein